MWRYNVYRNGQATNDIADDEVASTTMIIIIVPIRYSFPRSAGYLLIYQILLDFLSSASLFPSRVALVYFLNMGWDYLDDRF